MNQNVYIKKLIRELLTDKKNEIDADTFGPVLDQLVTPLAEVFHAPVRLNRSETAAITLSLPKTSALIFDRVWSINGWPVDVPDDMRFGGASQIEMEYVVKAALGIVLWNVYAKVKFDQQIDNRIKDLMKTWIAGRMLGILEHSQVDLGRLTKYVGLPRDEIAPRVLADVAAIEYSAPIIPIYPSAAELEQGYQPGKQEVLFAVLDGLRLVAEDHLKWEQVREFRRDRESKRKLLRMTRWLDNKMIGVPVNLVIEELERTIEDYYFALHTHGIRTLKGTFSSLVNLTDIAKAIGAGAASASVFGHETAAPMMLGAFGVNATVKVINGLIDLKNPNVQRPPEIAFAIELGKLDEKRKVIE